MEPIEFNPIGVIHSPFTTPQGTPIQPAGALGVAGTVDVKPEYLPGLQDLAGFSHVHLLYYFHLAKPYALKVTPYMDEVERGVFATRAPARPNAIGISVVRLVAIENTRLRVEDIDVLDGTPLLDIKPYVPAFDARPAERIGWMHAVVHKAGTTRADDRFR
jgi:tRNA-Thr(GGU) m(6)t(6)A37 methyltransferase TsaA